MLGSILAKSDTSRITVDGHEMVMYKTGKSGPGVLLEVGGNSNHISLSSIVSELSKTMTVLLMTVRVIWSLFPVPNQEQQTELRKN